MGNLHRDDPPHTQLRSTVLVHASSPPPPPNACHPFAIPLTKLCSVQLQPGTYAVEGKIYVSKGGVERQGLHQHLGAAVRHTHAAHIKPLEGFVLLKHLPER
jgi:hypothetical protein